MEYVKPRTIDELKQFCAEKGMPLEKMRFFIGEDYPHPRAFGIYQDQYGSFVVYKNKANGSRAIRYQGPDEAYAVNEIYEKLKSEVELRKRNQKEDNAYNAKFVKRLVIIIVVVCLLSGLYSVFFEVKPGYYKYQNHVYYHIRNDWYIYNDFGSWDRWYDVDDGWEQTIRDYHLSTTYDSSYGADDFMNSSYYDDYDWDSSSSTYDSWDSFDTDWSSDW